ncbi:MAG: WYL domain-containing protein [Treponema sp.]|nr:WYL domain-containing protein [Candidatus Treponema equifaecale]
MERKKEQPHILNNLLKIERAIRNGNYPNSRDLASIIEKSTKTVQRYIQILQNDYDAPIEFDFSKNGYYYTDNNFFIQNVMLTEGELLTLSAIFPILEQYRNTPFEQNFRQIMGKITDMLPENVSVDSSLVNDEIRFISDPIVMLQNGVFDAVLKAIKVHKTLEFEYKTGRSESFEYRKFDPYHIICHKGSWYLIGFSHKSNAIRIYAMPRIRNVRLTETIFKIPEGFKLENHIDPDFGIWNSETPNFKAEVLIDSRMKTYAMEREWHKNQTIKENEDGTVYISFETNQIDQTAEWVLEFGGAAKVLNPPELVEAIKKIATNILKRYE